MMKAFKTLCAFALAFAAAFPAVAFADDGIEEPSTTSVPIKLYYDGQQIQLRQSVSSNTNSLTLTFEVIPASEKLTPTLTASMALSDSIRSAKVAWTSNDKNEVKVVVSNGSQPLPTINGALELGILNISVNSPYNTATPNSAASIVVTGMSMADETFSGVASMSPPGPEDDSNITNFNIAQTAFNGTTNVPDDNAGNNGDNNQNNDTPGNNDPNKDPNKDPDKDPSKEPTNDPDLPNLNPVQKAVVVEIPKTDTLSVPNSGISTLKIQAASMVEKIMAGTAVNGISSEDAQRIKEIMNGHKIEDATITISLDVVDFAQKIDSLPQREADLLKAAVFDGNYEMLGLYNIKVSLTVVCDGNTASASVEELDEPVDLAVTASKGALDGKYAFVLYVHKEYLAAVNGDKVTTNNESNTVLFKADKFSTYAIYSSDLPTTGDSVIGSSAVPAEELLGSATNMASTGDRIIKSVLIYEIVAVVAMTIAFIAYRRMHPKQRF